ncbi:hypothetical protein ACWEP3_06450, partial [Streptomyces albidoflavus]
GRVCVLVHLDHRRGLWSLGVVRATEDLLLAGGHPPVTRPPERRSAGRVAPGVRRARPGG